MTSTRVSAGDTVLLPSAPHHHYLLFMSFYSFRSLHITSPIRMLHSSIPLVYPLKRSYVQPGRKALYKATGSGNGLKQVSCSVGTQVLSGLGLRVCRAQDLKAIFEHEGFR